MEKKIKIIVDMFDLQNIVTIMASNMGYKPDLSSLAELTAKYDTDKNAYIIDTTAIVRQFSKYAECNPLPFHLCEK